MAGAFAQWFAEGRVVEAICVLMALETMVLLLYRRSTGRGLAAADLLGNAAAGAALLLALRAAVIGSGPLICSLWLLSALAAHLLDLRQRWRRQRGCGPSR